jgi:hypothetical protein
MYLGANMCSFDSLFLPPRSFTAHNTTMGSTVVLPVFIMGKMVIS